MKHMYFTIRDKVAKKYVHVCESENAKTMTRLCRLMAESKETFIGQSQGDYVAYLCGYFDDETGKFEPVELEKVWEGKPNE